MIIGLSRSTRGSKNGNCYATKKPKHTRVDKQSPYQSLLPNKKKPSISIWIWTQNNKPSICIWIMNTEQKIDMHLNYEHRTTNPQSAFELWTQNTKPSISIWNMNTEQHRVGVIERYFIESAHVKLAQRIKHCLPLWCMRSPQTWPVSARVCARFATSMAPSRSPNSISEENVNRPVIGVFTICVSVSKVNSYWRDFVGDRGSLQLTHQGIERVYLLSFISKDVFRIQFWFITHAISLKWSKNSIYCLRTPRNKPHRWAWLPDSKFHQTCRPRMVKLAPLSKHSHSSWRTVLRIFHSRYYCLCLFSLFLFSLFSFLKKKTENGLLLYHMIWRIYNIWGRLPLSPAPGNIKLLILKKINFFNLTSFETLGLQ